MILVAGIHTFFDKDHMNISFPGNQIGGILAILPLKPFY